MLKLLSLSGQKNGVWPVWMGPHMPGENPAHADGAPWGRSWPLCAGIGPHAGPTYQIRALGLGTTRF